MKSTLNWKRTVALVLSIIILSPQFDVTQNGGVINTISVYAKSNNNSSTEVSECKIISDEENGTLTITATSGSSTLDSSNVKKYTNATKLVIRTEENASISISSSTFCDFHNLESIEINGNITSLGSSAFCELLNLKSVTMSLDNYIYISESAFSGCTSLEEIVLPSTIINIGGDAFYGCTSLKSITITGTGTTINKTAFSNCENLTTVYYPQGYEDTDSYNCLPVAIDYNTFWVAYEPIEGKTGEVQITDITVKVPSSSKSNANYSDETNSVFVVPATIASDTVVSIAVTDDTIGKISLAEIADQTTVVYSGEDYTATYTVMSDDDGKKYLELTSVETAKEEEEENTEESEETEEEAPETDKAITIPNEIGGLNVKNIGEKAFTAIPAGTEIVVKGNTEDSDITYTVVADGSENKLQTNVEISAESVGGLEILKEAAETVTIHGITYTLTDTSATVTYVNTDADIVNILTTVNGIPVKSITEIDFGSTVSTVYYPSVITENLPESTIRIAYELIDNGEAVSITRIAVPTGDVTINIPSEVEVSYTKAETSTDDDGSEDSLESTDTEGSVIKKPVTTISKSIFSTAVSDGNIEDNDTSDDSNINDDDIVDNNVDNTSNDDSNNGNIEDKEDDTSIGGNGTTTSIAITIPDSVTKIEEGALTECENLSAVSLPCTFKYSMSSIGVNNNDVDVVYENHTIVSYSNVSAKCTSSGYTGGSYCSECGTVLTQRTIVPAIGHNYGEPTFTWNGTECTATFTCARNSSHTLTLDCKMSVEDTNEKTIHTATATLDGKTYTNTMEVLNPVETTESTTTTLETTTTPVTTTTQIETTTEVTTTETTVPTTTESTTTENVTTTTTTETTTSESVTEVTTTTQETTESTTTTTEVTTTQAETEPTITTDEDFLLGDTSINGEVDSHDLLLLKRHILKILDLEDGSLAFRAGDINQDGKLQSVDLLIFKKFLLRMIDTLG